MDNSTKIAGIDALAAIFYTALCGVKPSTEMRNAAVQHWQQQTVSPWQDTESAPTYQYGELFFTELQSLQQTHDLKSKWSCDFNSDGQAKNTTIANAFVSACFNLLIHTPRTYHDFSCLQYLLSEGHFLDFPIVHPVAVDFWTMYSTRDGRGEISVAGQEPIELGYGSVALIPPGCQCEVRRAAQSEQWQTDVLSFRSQPEWFELLDWAFSLESPMVVHIEIEEALVRLKTQFNELQSIAYQRGDINERLCHNIIENLLIRLRRVSEMENRLPPADLRVRKAIEYVLPRYCENVSLEEVASHAGLSASRLNSLFRQQYGTSLIKWRDRMRLQKAQELLNHTTLAISDISNRVGYDDALYFSRRYKKQFGFPPSQQR